MQLVRITLQVLNAVAQRVARIQDLPDIIKSYQFLSRAATVGRHACHAYLCCKLHDTLQIYISASQPALLQSGDIRAGLPFWRSAGVLDSILLMWLCSSMRKRLA